MAELVHPSGDLESGEDSDSSLLEQISAGHPAALDTLVDRYWTSLVTYAARFLPNWDVADDIAQETFIRLWERREEWKLEGSVRALLYQITRNLALDERKRLNRATSWADDRQWDAASHVPTPSEHLLATDLKAAFERCLAALPDRRREIFLNTRLHGLSYRETAEAMEIAPQTVANQLSAAVAELRYALKFFLDEQPRPTPSSDRRSQVDQ